DNAARHARHSVTLTVRDSGSAIELVVRDDGAGVPPGLTEAAFERFVSLDGRGGSGLGLPIARGICEAHGGTLRYEDRSFVARIPKHAAGGRPRSGLATEPDRN